MLKPLYHLKPIKILTCLIILSISIQGLSQNYKPAKPLIDKQQLKVFYCQELIYPENALDKKQEGTVDVELQVNSDGTTENYSIKKSVSKDLDKEAIRLSKKLLWQPAIKFGEPVNSLTNLPVKFDISKYYKNCKKRDFKKITYPYEPIDTSNIVYVLDEVDDIPRPVFEDKNENYPSFITKNIVYPEAAFTQDISGVVTVSFIIEPHGRITHVIVESPLGGGCTEEAVRLIRMLKWMPGIKDNMAVRTKMELNITFHLDADSKMKYQPSHQGTSI